MVEQSIPLPMTSCVPTRKLDYSMSFKILWRNLLMSQHKKVASSSISICVLSNLPMASALTNLNTSLTWYQIHGWKNLVNLLRDFILHSQPSKWPRENLPKQCRLSLYNSRLLKTNLEACMQVSMENTCISWFGIVLNWVMQSRVMYATLQFPPGLLLTASTVLSYYSSTILVALLCTHKM